MTRLRRSPRRAAATLAVGLVAVLSLGACTSDGSGLSDIDPGAIGDGDGGGDGDGAGDGGGDVAPEPEPEPAPEPDPAPEPEPEPAPEAPAPEVPAVPEVDPDDGFTTEEWVLIAILGVAAFALIIGVTSAASNHSDKKRAQATADRRRVGEVVGLARWLVDQGSVDVLRATDAHQLQTAWASVRQRSIDIETRSSSLSASVDDGDVSATLAGLANDTAAFRGVLETNVSLRLDPNANTDVNRALIADTTNSVYQRRQDIHMDLSRLSNAYQ